METLADTLFDLLIGLKFSGFWRIRVRFFDQLCPDTLSIRASTGCRRPDAATDYGGSGVVHAHSGG